MVGHFATGVTVITTRHDGLPFGTTASAVSSLSLEPPMLLVCLNLESTTGQAVARSRRLAVNILGEDQADLAARFARKGDDKFDGVAYRDSAEAIPLLGEALAHLECRVTEEVSGGTHSVYLAEVVRGSAEPRAPLAYFRGQFGRLAPAGDEGAVRELRAAILARELPDGARLTPADVAARYGLDRGTAYHALAELAQERLLEHGPDGSFGVRPLTFETLEDALRAQLAIELGVAALTVGRTSAAELTELRELNAALGPAGPGEDPVPIRAWIGAYNAFHRRLVGLAASRELSDTWARINVHLTIAALLEEQAPRADAFDVRNMLQTYLEHAELLDAYEHGDLASATAAIRRHLQHVARAPRERAGLAGGQP